MFYIKYKTFNMEVTMKEKIKMIPGVTKIIDIKNKIKEKILKKTEFKND